MGQWDGSPELYDLIAEFPVKLKQAMYAAASSGQINNGTWNNCALNAASKVQEAKFSNTVSSTIEATRVFGITVAQANNFIHCWDTIRGDSELLKETILQVGLFKEPGKDIKPRIVKKRVFTSEETAMKEEFDRMVEASQIPDTDIAAFFFNEFSEEEKKELASV